MYALCLGVIIHSAMAIRYMPMRTKAESIHLFVIAKIRPANSKTIQRAVRFRLRYAVL